MSGDRKTTARFRVMGHLDRAGGMQIGTVLIDPSGTFRVRPLRRVRTYDLPLDTVADMVVQRVIKAEVFKKQMTKAKERKARRRR